MRTDVLDVLGSVRHTPTVSSPHPRPPHQEHPAHTNAPLRKETRCTGVFTGFCSLPLPTTPLTGTSNVPSEDPYTPVWAAHHDHLYCDRNAVVGIPLTESSSLPQQNAHYMYRVTSRPRYKIQSTFPSSGTKKGKRRFPG